MNRRSFLKAALVTAAVGPSLASSRDVITGWDVARGKSRTAVAVCYDEVVSQMDEDFIKTWMEIRPAAIKIIFDGQHPIYEMIKAKEFYK